MQVRDELKKYWPVLGIEMKVKRPVPPTPAPSLSAEVNHLLEDYCSAVSVY